MADNDKEPEQLISTGMDIDESMPEELKVAKKNRGKVYYDNFQDTDDNPVTDGIDPDLNGYTLKQIDELARKKLEQQLNKIKKAEEELKKKMTNNNNLH